MGWKEGDEEVSKNLFALGWQDLQMNKAYSLYRLKGSCIQLPNLLFASKWIDADAD